MTSLNDVLLAMSNIPVDDPIAEIWGRGLQGGYTVIEYTGALPITINADGNSLLDYRIYGNTEQSGTPTPENPIMPIGCGERFDITGLSEPLCGIQTYTDSLNLSTGILTRRIKKLVLTGEENWRYNKAVVSGNSYAESSIFTNYKTRSGIGYCTHYPLAVSSSAKFGIYFGANINFITNFSEGIDTVEKWKFYLAAQYAAGTPVTVWYVLAEPDASTITIPSGLTGTIEGYLTQDGTPTPETPIYPTANGVKQEDGTYSIPYGYKLPILSNSTVTNIYLGEVETTRMIKKLVLTGEENWLRQKPEHTNCINLYTAIRNAKSESMIMSNVVTYSNMAGINNDSLVNVGRINDAGTYLLMDFELSKFSTLSAWKTYLQQQYAAGTPVTVWYVLAEPETAVVNEPLMKTGDYADTINMEQANVQIPTNKGTTVIDYNGATKPSEMYIKYGGKND